VLCLSVGCEGGLITVAFKLHVDILPKKHVQFCHHNLEFVGKLILYSYYLKPRGPGSSVSIGTGYGLDGPGIESW
jgi:hypothetical protein